MGPFHIEKMPVTITVLVQTCRVDRPPWHTQIYLPDKAEQCNLDASAVHLPLGVAPTLLYWCTYTAADSFSVDRAWVSNISGEPEVGWVIKWKLVAVGKCTFQASLNPPGKTWFSEYFILQLLSKRNSSGGSLVHDDKKTEGGRVA